MSSALHAQQGFKLPSTVRSAPYPDQRILLQPEWRKMLKDAIGRMQCALTIDLSFNI